MKTRRAVTIVLCGTDIVCVVLAVLQAARPPAQDAVVATWGTSIIILVSAFALAFTTWHLLTLTQAGRPK